MTRLYAKAAAAHRIANRLGIPFGAAWRVANCLAKVSYRTEDEAADAAALWRQKGSEQMPYECDVCGKWHLTSRDSDDDARADGAEE